MRELDFIRENKNFFPFVNFFSIVLKIVNKVLSKIDVENKLTNFLHWMDGLELEALKEAVLGLRQDFGGYCTTWDMSK